MCVSFTGMKYSSVRGEIFLLSYLQAAAVNTASVGATAAFDTKYHLAV